VLREWTFENHKLLENLHKKQIKSKFQNSEPPKKYCPSQNESENCPKIVKKSEAIQELESWKGV